MRTPRWCALLLVLLPLMSSAAVPVALPPAVAGQVTYVDFWASWCGPCAEAFPWLNQMQTKYGARGFRVIGVGVDSEDRKAQRFLQAHPAQFQIIRDAEGALAERYNIEGMPYAVILDADGKILHRHSGFDAGNTADYEKAIEAALTAKGKHQ